MFFFAAALFLMFVHVVHAFTLKHIRIYNLKLSSTPSCLTSSKWCVLAWPIVLVRVAKLAWRRAFLVIHAFTNSLCLARTRSLTHSATVTSGSANHAGGWGLLFSTWCVWLFLRDLLGSNTGMGARLATLACRFALNPPLSCRPYFRACWYGRSGGFGTSFAELAMLATEVLKDSWYVDNYNRFGGHDGGDDFGSSHGVGDDDDDDDSCDGRGGVNTVMVTMVMLFARILQLLALSLLVMPAMLAMLAALALEIILSKLSLFVAHTAFFP